MTQNLIRPFADARLRLDLPTRPFAATNEAIFQMDIHRARGGERFRLWPGDASNSIRVTDLDRGRRQLVILVQEAARAFEERIQKRFSSPVRLDAEFRHAGGRLVRETPTAYVIERWTPGSMRRYLCGMDESHLFIAQVPGGTTVRDAHRELKPAAVRDAERSRPGRILRQGEWFFVPPPEGEREVLALHLREMPYALRRRESLGGNGRPHVADEVVRIADRVYARGSIRHPDHKTLLLDGWRRVHRNAEVHQNSFGSNGVFWID
jgi:hypothetical protein